MGLPSECPLCLATRDNIDVVTSRTFGESHRKRAFYLCNKCKVIFQYPRLTPTEEKLFYAQEFEKFMDSRSGSESGWMSPEDHVRSNQDNVSRRLKTLEKYLRSSKNVLEVGCSSGFMLRPFLENGSNCVGVEPSGIFSEFVKEQGIVVFDDLHSLIKDNSSAQFDLIMHYFVLEHIVDPITFLKDQINLLTDNGMIFLEVPNSNDALFSIYDMPAFERFYWSKAHPWYFNEESLDYLLTRMECKYEIILEQRYDLSNHMWWALNGKPGGMGKFTKFFGTEIEENYKSALINAGLCDTMFAIIYKN